MRMPKLLRAALQVSTRPLALVASAAYWVVAAALIERRLSPVASHADEGGRRAQR